MLPNKLDFFQKIQKAALFSGMEPAEIQALFKAVRTRSRRFMKRQVLHQQGMSYNQLFIVSRGRCQGELNRASGKVLIVEEFPAPCAVAPGILFARENNLPVSLVAATDCEILSVPAEDVFQVWFRHERFLRNFMADISEKIFLLSRRLEILSFTTIRAKLAWYCLSRGRESFEMQNSLDELARYLGITRPSLSRSLAEMEAEGLLKKERRRITLVDTAGLKAILE